MQHQTKLLINDLLGSFTSWRLWASLGWNDIAKQYRRSFIGPIWIALNTGIFIVGFGYIGAQLFKTNFEDYLPFFCAGQVVASALSLANSDMPISSPLIGNSLCALSATPTLLCPA